jgi:hypothetical protein
MATFTVRALPVYIKCTPDQSLVRKFESTLIVDKFCGNRRKIVKNQGAHRQGLAQSLFAFPGLY